MALLAPTPLPEPASGTARRGPRSARTCGRLGDIAGLLRVATRRARGSAGQRQYRHGAVACGTAREAVAELKRVREGSLPALVVGDESLDGRPGSRRHEGRRTSAPRAVSGTNVTVVLVAVLGLARWVGVTGTVCPHSGCRLWPASYARPPRAQRCPGGGHGNRRACRLTASGRRRGVPTLAAVLVLLLLDPWLGTEAGFALSVLATAGILLAWRPRGATPPWVPRPVAEVARACAWRHRPPAFRSSSWWPHRRASRRFRRTSWWRPPSLRRRCSARLRQSCRPCHHRWPRARVVCGTPRHLDRCGGQTRR